MRSTMQKFGTRRILTSVGAVALIGLAPTFLTACNDKDSGSPVPASAPGTVAGKPQTGGQTGAPSGQSTVRTVGKTGWFEGFAITVDKATVVPDQSGGRLVLDLTYKNLTTENKTLSTNAYLQIGGQIDQAASFDSPTVPGQGSAAGKITTSVQPGTDADHLLDTVIVVFGQTSDNQTKIPLQTDAQVESVQPKTLAVTGTLVQDQTTIQVTGGTLRPSYTKNEHGKYELALHVKIIGGAGIPAGGANIFNEYFAVKTPDGQSLVADDRTPINELLEKGQTIDNPKDVATFLVAAPGTGNYVLTYNAKKEADPAAPTLSFTVN